MARYRYQRDSWTCTVESIRDDRADVSIRVRFRDHMERLLEAGFKLIEDVYDEKIDSWYADVEGEVAVSDLEEIDLDPAVGAGLDFEQLRRGHEGRVARWLGRWVPEAEVDQLVEEVFRDVKRRLPAYRGDASLTRWLHTITRQVSEQRPQSH